MTLTSENRIIARRYLSELWSRGILDTADEIVAPHCELNDPLCGGGVGPEALKAAVRELRTPFPDLAFSLDAFIVETEHQLALRWCAHGTHRAPLLGLPATERAFLVSGLLLLRFEASKLIAVTTCWEPTLLLEQLGLFDLPFDPAPCEPLSVPAPELAAPDLVAFPEPVSVPTPRSTPVPLIPPPPRPRISMHFAMTPPESEVDAGWA